MMTRQFGHDLAVLTLVAAPLRVACRGRVLYLAVAALSCGNTSAPIESASLTWVTDTTGDVAAIRLDASPTTMSSTKGVHQLSPDLVRGGRDDGFGYVRDVAVTHDGQIAVLDVQNAEVVFHSPDGGVQGRIGRRGRGPGELHNPLAIAAIDSAIVIWDFDPSKTFTFVDGRSGTLISTAPSLIEGDWNPARGTHDFMAPSHYSTSWEDPSRRLGPIGRQHFIHQLQDDERAALSREDSAQIATPSSYLVRYDMHGSVVDTVATMSAPASVFTTLPRDRRGRPLPGGRRFVNQEVYTARPLWTADEDWIALGHGNTAEITVSSWDGEQLGVPLMKVSWPESRRSTSDDDHIRHLEWLFAEGPKFGHQIPPDYPRSQSRRRKYLAQILPELREKHPFAEYTPEVTALFGAGRCLWIAGFQPEDYPDGTALTLVAINVADSTVESTVRIARAGSRLRHISETAIYTVYADEDGVQFVERYPHHLDGCQRQRRTHP